jgi:tRNA threonylcarbamoyl adenosine modification protein (Sua5/YciO/YrdC/YwlC family)
MSRRILAVDDDRDAALERAAAVLRDGRLVVLPTDTVYAVAADAFDTTGTRRVFGAKRRSRRYPLAVLVRSPKQLLGLCPDVPESADRLMAAYWPGRLTIIVPADPGLEWDLGDTRGALAVRMPLDDLVLDLVRDVGPLAATSANLSGQAPASTASGAHQQLGDRVEVYLDDGPRGGAQPSTIVDLTRSEPAILREGPLPGADVLAVARGDLDPLEAAARVRGPDPADGDTPTGDGTR